MSRVKTIIVFMLRRGKWKWFQDQAIHKLTRALGNGVFIKSDPDTSKTTLAVLMAKIFVVLGHDVLLLTTKPGAVG